MPKNIFTPRSELVCGKLDELAQCIVDNNAVRAMDLVELVRQDCERMEKKLQEYKDMVYNPDTEEVF